MSRRTNLVAFPVTDLALNEDRNYLMVVADSDLEITISGGEPFTLPAGQAWEPPLCPINAITFSGTGTILEG